MIGECANHDPANIASGPTTKAGFNGNRNHRERLDPIGHPQQRRAIRRVKVEWQLSLDLEDEIAITPKSHASLTRQRAVYHRSMPVGIRAPYHTTDAPIWTAIR